MKIAALFALGLAVLTGCAPSEWQELRIPEGGFAVLMRGQPHYVSQDVETPEGRMLAHLFSSDQPDAYFAVGYADYPLVSVVTGSRDELLTGVRDTWVKRVSGRLILSSPVTLAGKYPGIEFSAEGRVKDADTFLHARLYLVDQRLYQVISMGRKSETPQGLLNRYVNSFRLLSEAEVEKMQTKPRRKR